MSTSSTSSNDNLNRGADAHSAADVTRPPFANAGGLPEMGGLRASTPSSRLIGWDGNGSDPEQFLDWSKPGMLWFDPCAECGMEFVFVRSRGRPRGFCSENCARAYELRHKREARRALDPGIGSEERKDRQLEGLRLRKQLEEADALVAATIRDLYASGPNNLMESIGGTWGDDSPTIKLRHVHPASGSPSPSPPRGVHRDPYWDALEEARLARLPINRVPGRENADLPEVYWQRVRWIHDDEAWTWEDESVGSPMGYLPNGPREIGGGDQRPWPPSTAPQPWEPRRICPPEPYFLREQIDEQRAAPAEVEQMISNVDSISGMALRLEGLSLEIGAIAKDLQAKYPTDERLSASVEALLKSLHLDGGDAPR